MVQRPADGGVALDRLLDAGLEADAVAEAEAST